MTVAPLNTFGTRAVWEWITMIGAQSFTGEVRLTSEPILSIYALRGETYWAEQAGDPPVADRLVSVGALQPAQVDRGAVRIGNTVNLSRLFERDQTVDRHVVEVAVELLRDDLLERVAMQPTAVESVAPLRMHPSGVQRWFTIPGATATGATTDVEANHATAPAGAVPTVTVAAAASAVEQPPAPTVPAAAPAAVTPATAAVTPTAAAAARPATPPVQFDFDRAFAPLNDMTSPRPAPITPPRRDDAPEPLSVDPTPSQQVPVFKAAPIPLAPTVVPTSLTELWTMADSVIPGDPATAGPNKDPNNG
jgi:hypothetical protein